MIILKPNIFLLPEWWFRHHNSTNLWCGPAIRKSNSWIWYLHSGNIFKKNVVSFYMSLICEVNINIYLFIDIWQKIQPLKDVRTVPPLDCNSQQTWTHGSSLINYMKLQDFMGLSGRIKFDTYGKRTDFQLNVLELTRTGLETIGNDMAIKKHLILLLKLNTIVKLWYKSDHNDGLPHLSGTWSATEKLNLSHSMEVIEIDNSLNVMANKSFVVTMIESNPYVMLKQEVIMVIHIMIYGNITILQIFYIFLFLSKPKQLIGNARFEGFGVDLMDKIARILNFTIAYKLVDDDKV